MITPKAVATPIGCRNTKTAYTNPSLLSLRVRPPRSELLHKWWHILNIDHNCKTFSYEYSNLNHKTLHHKHPHLFRNTQHTGLTSPNAAIDRCRRGTSMNVPILKPTRSAPIKPHENPVIDIHQPTLKIDAIRKSRTHNDTLTLTKEPLSSTTKPNICKPSNNKRIVSSNKLKQESKAKYRRLTSKSKKRLSECYLSSNDNYKQAPNETGTGRKRRLSL